MRARRRHQAVGKQKARRLKRLAIPALAAAALLFSASSAFSTHEVSGELLPDLQTLEPRDFDVQTVRNARYAEERLRFDNEVVNAHTGPLELFPASEDCDGDGDTRNDRTAYQRIFGDTNGDGWFLRGTDQESRTVKAGCMVFHPMHQHWHFENFSLFELYALNADGSRGSRVATSGKVTFCVADVHRVYPALPGSPDSAYYDSCDRNSTQGLSVGWSDEYPSGTEGQYLVVTNLADGDYCFVSTADPWFEGDPAHARLVETDDSNNGESIAIALQGTSVIEHTGSTC